MKLKSYKRVTVYAEVDFSSIKSPVINAIEPLQTRDNELEVRFSSDDSVNVEILVIKNQHSRPTWGQLSAVLSEALNQEVSL